MQPASKHIATDQDAIAAVVGAMYAAISGPAGPRDWRLQETFFHSDARMMRTEIAADGSAGLHIMDRTQYREDTSPYFDAHPFYEVEIDRRIDVFGDIAQVWSVYEARTNPVDKHPERRGINSIQLQRDATGDWRIVSMLWDNER